jgi:uncharacterized protein (TIGR03085 family)
VPRYARIERERLADALLDAGPDAATLCAGWTTADLAAHVVIRDRRPDAAVGIMVKPLAGWTDRVRRQYRDGHPYPELVQMVRDAPSWNAFAAVPSLDELTNLIEFFVHHEDVRRGRPGWQPRDLDPDLAAELWKRVPTLVKMRLRRGPARVVVTAPGHGEFTAGSSDEAAPVVTIRGGPGELLLFFFGRQPATRVEIGGPEALVAKLRGLRSPV